MLIRHFQRKPPSHAYHVNTMAVPWQVAGGMIQSPLCHRYYKVPMKKKKNPYIPRPESVLAGIGI